MGPVLGGLLGGKMKQFYLMFGYLIHFTVTLDELNLFGESYSHQLKIIPVTNEFYLSFSKKCLEQI